MVSVYSQLKMAWWFRKGHVKMIKILCTDPTALVLTVRRGWPLRPFLFAITLEPTAQIVHQCADNATRHRQSEADYML